MCKMVLHLFLISLFDVAVNAVVSYHPVGAASAASDARIVSQMRLYVAHSQSAFTKACVVDSPRSRHVINL